jgi:hypothetical protein
LSSYLVLFILVGLVLAYLAIAIEGEAEWGADRNGG